MLQNAKLAFVLILMVLGGFVFGLVRLFQIRFEAGDVYPEYSSLRADPLGCKALHDSLASLVTTRRNYQQYFRLPAGKNTTLLYLGAELDDLRLPAPELKDLETFIYSGGRLVVALYPRFQRPVSMPAPSPVTATNAPTGPGNPQKPKRPSKGHDLQRIRPVEMSERWDFKLRYVPLTKGGTGAYRPTEATRESDLPLPETLQCHTAVVFAQPGPAWRIIYSRSTNGAVLMERKMGDGTVVVAADSYLLSNEAMVADRQPSLLTWLIGGNETILFDETHLGVAETTGVAMLMRKYRLHGLFIGLLVLAGLFVWRRSTSLVPGRGDANGPEEVTFVSGRDSSAGFVNLLRRNIPHRELLGVCLAEWKKSCGATTRESKLREMQVVIDQENSVAPAERDSLKTYRAIAQILCENKLYYERKR